MIKTALLLLFVWVFAAQTHAAVIASSSSSPPLPTSAQTQTPTSDTVSWQSAFWTLLALALNAMTQNSPLDHDFPTRVLFPARSSPLICAADILDIILRLFVYVFSGASLPDAAKRLLQDRMWQSPTRSEELAKVARESLTLSNRYPLAHTVLFVLGILPQAVKLFGMRGIPWTQACGGLYLSSFLVTAGVGALARSARGDIPLASAVWAKRPMRMLYSGVVMMQVGFWAWNGYTLLGPFWGSFKQSSVFYFILVMMPMRLTYQVVFCAVVALPFILALDGCPTIVGVVCLFAGPPLVILWFVAAEGYLLPLLIDNVDYVAIPLYFSVTILFASRVAFPYFQRTLPIAPIFFFAVTNLVVSILYYRFRYSSIGTFKPSWADKLG